MPRYISLLNLTEKGIADPRSIPERIEASKRAFSAAGATFVDIYLVTGMYDYVLITDAPDDETMARVAFEVGMEGNVRSQTFRAFSQAEIARIVGQIG